MGQRILITEEERNRIKNLYEVSTPPPPDESLSVAIKNPFKYPEFEDARRVYSSQLKDGDRFYKTTLFYDEFMKGENSPFRTLYNSFLNKTIRLVSQDSIVTIRETSSPVAFYHNSLDDINNNAVVFSYNLNNQIYHITYVSQSNSTKIERYYTHGTNKSGLGFVRQEEDPEIFMALSSIASKLKTTHTDYFKDLSQIPDEAFDIRKIQREKTDF